MIFDKKIKLKRKNEKYVVGILPRLYISPGID